MREVVKGLLTAAVAATAPAAEAGWGYSYAAPSYYHAPPVYGYGAAYGPAWGYSAAYGPAWGYGAAYGPALGYGAAYGPAYGPAFGAYAVPRGEIEYDVYTPYGRYEVGYRVLPNGTVAVDIDD